MFLTVGTIAAVVTAITFLIARRGPITTVFFSAVAFFVWGAIAWASIPTLAWNFSAPWALLFFFGVSLAVGLSFSGERGYREDTVTASEGVAGIIPALSILAPVVMIFVSWFTTDGFFGHETQYRAWLDRTPVTREFTDDVAPIDLEHLRLVNQTLAERLASRTVEQVPSLGSRVHVATPDQQILNGCFTAATGIDENARQERLCFENELVYVAPLAHDSVFRYWNYGSTPGYVVVSAEDPDRFWLVTGLVQNTEVTPIALRYLVDGGWFNHQVQRYLRGHGYASTGLSEEMFEIDDTGRPFWVITTFERTIGFGGEVPNGVLVMDAQTGTIQRYTMETVPQWVDMAQPREIVAQMLDSWGQYVNGWLNGSMFGAKRDVVRTGDYMTVLHGQDQHSHYVVDLSSANSGHDGAMNSFVLVDTRTREVARYMLSGATPLVAAGTIENAEGVRANSYTAAGVYPVNVNGEPSYFVPLEGQDGMLKMYGFINIRNLAVYGTGDTPTAAFRAYQAALTRGGTRLNADAIVSGERVEGVVGAVAREGETIYLLIDGQNGREFFAASTLSPELKWTNAGDRVVLTAQAGEQSTVPMVAFDNLGLSLTPQ